MKNITENCILDPEIIKTRSMNIFSSNNVNLSDEKICRTIATNSMLWEQFVYLKDKIKSQAINQKIKIILREKMIILFL